MEEKVMLCGMMNIASDNQGNSFPAITCNKDYYVMVEFEQKAQEIMQQVKVGQSIGVVGSFLDKEKGILKIDRAVVPSGGSPKPELTI